MLPRLALVAALVVVVAHSRPVRGCGFIESAGHVVTLREQAAASKIIVFGRLENAQRGPDGGTTDLVIIKTVKGDRVLEGMKLLRIPRYINITDPKNPSQLLAFGEVTKGEVVFFAGFFGNLALVEYVEGIMPVEAKDRVKVMRYCFNFLDHKDPAIAADAFAEFLKSTDPDIRKAGRVLPADKLRSWLQDDKTSPERLRLYAFLLANCGNQQDAPMLRRLLDNLVEKDSSSLIDGILTAYTLLSPKDGWAYTAKLLSDPTPRFIHRYAALRAARYFYTNQPEVVPEKELLGAIRNAIEQPDMADLPIGYLRQWKCWKLTDQILSLSKKNGFEAPIIQRSILYYALQCPHAQAARFVADMRKADPTFVGGLEEDLRYEAEATGR